MFRFSWVGRGGLGARLRVPAHVASAAPPLETQLRSVLGAAAAATPDAASGGDASAASSVGRSASSLLQDWVMLAHKRPSTVRDDASPELCTSTGWTSDETALIAKMLMATRQWDPSKQVLAGPRTVARARVTATTVSPSVTASTPSRTSAAAAEIAASATPAPAEHDATGAAPAATRLKARVVVRTAATPEPSSNQNASAAQTEQAGDGEPAPTQRRKVVRVGLAARK